MKFEQLIKEMKKSSGLSEYYFEMLRSVGWSWEDFIKKWNDYTRISEKDGRWAIVSGDMVRRAQKLGERLGYIFQCIRKDTEKDYEKYETDEESKK